MADPFPDAKTPETAQETTRQRQQPLCRGRRGEHSHTTPTPGKCFTIHCGDRACRAVKKNDPTTGLPLNQYAEVTLRRVIAFQVNQQRQSHRSQFLGRH
jgi:hypothetical protein